MNDSTQPQPGQTFQPGGGDPADNTQTPPPTNDPAPGSDQPAQDAPDAPAQEPSTPPVAPVEPPSPGSDSPVTPPSEPPAPPVPPLDTPPADVPPPGAPPADPAPPGGPSAPPGANPSDTSGGDLPPFFTWEASEYVQHHHGALWYGGLLTATSGLVALSVLVLKEWLSAAVVVLMVAALLVYAHRAPRTLKYALNEAGITIGEKFYPYSDFRSFALITGQAFLTIELDPLRRFMPRLSLFVDDKLADELVGNLERHLPRADRKPDTVDRLAHALKF